MIIGVIVINVYKYNKKYTYNIVQDQLMNLTKYRIG